MANTPDIHSLSSSMTDSFSLLSTSASEEQIVWPLSSAATLHPRGSRPWADDTDSEIYARSTDTGSIDSNDEDEDDALSSSGASALDSDLGAGSDDFVLLPSRARPANRRARPTGAAAAVARAASPSPARTEDELAPAFAELAIASHSSSAAAAAPPSPIRKSRRKRKAAGAAARRAKAAGGAATPAAMTPPVSETESEALPSATLSKSQRRKQRRRAAALAQANAVTKVVPAASLPAGGSVLFSAYEEATRYITSFLSSPTPISKDKTTQLTFLHALIIELGLYTPLALPTPPSSPSSSSSDEQQQQQQGAVVSRKTQQLTQLPTTLTQARATLKASAFVNVREYLEARDGGRAALEAVMHPSRSSLVRSLHKRRDRVPVDAVKRAGLNVFLVNMYH